MEILLYFILGSALLFIMWNLIARLVRSIIHFPVPYFMVDLIDHPLRRLILQPTESSPRRHGVEAGMQVLEIGPGKGSYTLASASVVGETGRLVAIDIEPRVAHKLRRRALEEKSVNLDVLVANASRLPFRNGGFDLAYCIAVLGEIPNPVRAMKEWSRVLSPAGRLSISEIIPDPDYLTEEKVRSWAREAGFNRGKRVGNFIFYTLRFRKTMTE